MISGFQGRFDDTAASDPETPVWTGAVSGNGKPLIAKSVVTVEFGCGIGAMQVERVKYVIWAADIRRAVGFYEAVFGGRVVKRSDVISEVDVAGAVIGIHGGGEGKETWTGMSFQVADVIAGAAEVVGAGGKLLNDPQPEEGEPPHLAMCMDPEGNQFMLTRKRSGRR